MTDLVKLYNPANAAALTPEQIAVLKTLTSPQIKELATAFPNMTMQRAYLLIVDGSKPIDKQIPTLSTFENLWNLREKNGLRQFVAMNFKGIYKVKPVPQKGFKPKKQEVLDLSETELMVLPGFKTKEVKPETQITEVKKTAPTEVKVRKIRKSKIQ